MTRERCLLLSAGLVASAMSACVRDSALPPSAATPEPSASAEAAAPAALDAGGADVGAIEGGMPLGPPTWRSVPSAQNGFYAVLDGLCSQLSASRVGADVVISYGGGSTGMYIDGIRLGPASFIGLDKNGLVAIDAPTIGYPTGVTGRSLDDFWIADNTGTRSGGGSLIHRNVGGSWKSLEKDQTDLHPWLDGGVIGTIGWATANGPIWVEGSSTKPPDALSSDLFFPALAAFPTGDVLVLGPLAGTQDGPKLARHWAPGQKTTEQRVTDLPGGRARLAEIAPDEVYAFVDDRIDRWDGTTFRPLAHASAGQKIKNARRAAPDDLWVLTEAGTMQHITAAAATVIPTPEPVVDFDGVGDNCWIVGKSGKAFRRNGEDWQAVPLPTPPFSAGGVVKAKRVLEVAPDDVLLTLMYWEKDIGWTEQELHTALFRTKAVKETLRCNEPDPEFNNTNIGHGFQSWPPMATAECKTVFAVLARRSNATKKADDWPRIRAALKGHPELGDVSLVDFVSGDRSFVGAPAKDLDTAKTIVALVGKRDRVRPEIVCGEPRPTRTLAVDLVTGAATVK